MKKSIFIGLLLFLFLDLVSFNVQKDEEYKIVRQDSVNNSVKVEIKFQNPKLLVDDQRSVELFVVALENNLLINSSLEKALKETNVHLSEYIAVQNGIYTVQKNVQEKEGESSMDYLKRKTNMDEQEIQSALNRYHSVTVVTYIILLFLLAGFALSFINEHNKYERDWSHTLIKLISMLVILYCTYYVFHSWLLYIFAGEYMQLEHLIQLTT